MLYKKEAVKNDTGVHIGGTSEGVQARGVQAEGVQSQEEVLSSHNGMNNQGNDEMSFSL